MKYIYTYYRLDGEIVETAPRDKMTLEELQEGVGGMIEAVHPDYYPDDFDGTDDPEMVVYVDEEGRYKEDNQVNPHFKKLGGDFYIVGMALKEQPHRG